jgi:DNA adenine methylase
MQTDSNKIVPFLKWAGGKRWLIENYPDIFPKTFDRYIEPFLGGGAVFFYLKPKKAILSDINKDLIETYITIRDDYQSVEKELFFHQVNHCKRYYYEMRKKRLRAKVSKAAKFIYLNRTCFNGLYRVNLKGEFNVPIGTKDSVILPTDDFEKVSKLLNRVSLKISDFEKIISRASKGDFVFIDPPYTVKHNNNNFRKYNERIFSWQDQIRLRDAVTDAQKREAKIVVCNADCKSIINLYKGLGKIKRLDRFSFLSAVPSKRQRTTELAILFNI